MSNKHYIPEKSGIEKKLEKEMLEEAEREQADMHQPQDVNPPEVTRDPSAVTGNRGHENISMEPEDEQTAEAAAAEAGRESAESDLREEGKRVRE